METELEYWRRMQRLAHQYPTPLMNHVLGYIHSAIERCKREKDIDSSL
jgi:hypothetical protein